MTHSRYPVALMLTVAALGCSTASERSEVAPPVRRDSVPSTALLDADSVVLTSTLCFGPCPAYSVRIARSGAVHYFSGTHQETRTDSLAPDQVSALLREIVASTFFEYPLSTERDPSKCAPPGSDAPVRPVELYVGATRYRITGDVGCFWNPDTSVAELRSRVANHLADRIDAVAGTARWVRPRF